jgi:hypothetical protein
MRAKSFVTIDVLFNIALRDLKFQFVTKNAAKKNSCEVLSAHACSEIGLKWFLFAFHDLRKVLGFVSVLDFFEHLSS